MRLAAITLLILIGGVTEVNAGQVTAVGVAPILEQQVAPARKAALEAAKRAAVEQALGSYIESRTRVGNFSLASDTIYASVQGRIDRYEITLDEARPGDIYRIEIVATFEDDLLLSDTEQLLKKYHWHKKPRLLIDISGQDDSASKQEALQLQQGLEKKFRRHGFDVFDTTSNHQKSAGFLLQGTAFVSSQNSEFQGVELSSTELSVTVSLKRIGSGQIISSSSYNGSRPGSSGARTFKALNKDAVKKLYREISTQMSNEWLRYQSRGSDIVLQLSGSGVSGKLTKIKTDLNRILRGVRSISTDSADESGAVLSVVYVGWPEQLYDELSVALDKNNNVGLVIDGLSGNTLQLRIL